MQPVTLVATEGGESQAAGTGKILTESTPRAGNGVVFWIRSVDVPISSETMERILISTSDHVLESTEAFSVADSHREISIEV